MSEQETDGMGGLAVIGGGGLGIFDPNSSGMPVPPPFQQVICLVEETYVAGTKHVKDIDEAVEGLKVGDKLRFEREKGNLVDGWAIKVFAGSHRLGYVSVEVNEILARLMDGGKHVYGVVTGLELRGTWHKIHMEVDLDD